MQKKLEKKLFFTNDVINKRKLQDLMYQTFHNYGAVKSSIIADKVKNLTFHYATRSGISLNAEDLRVPYRKKELMGLTSNEVEITEQKYSVGNITSVERFQKVIDIWNNASNSLKDEVLTYFRESDPLNPLYIMAFSGARGNISQVRQLVGMRGLMADPQGQIIDLPIKSNFREGLKVTEYVISSYGARKGLVDTALRTADSGYLTRRLVDVAQDIIVREEDCLTTDSLSYDDLFQRYATTLSLKDRLLSRLLAESIFTSENKKLIASKDTEINLSLLKKLNEVNPKLIKVRSPLTCNSSRSICRKCYGWHLSYSRLVDLGEAVGIVAAQSIGEPGTQLTMRTFHTGGVFSGDLTRQIRAPFLGTIIYALKHPETTLVRTMHGEKGFNLNDSVDLYIENLRGTRCHLQIPEGNILLVSNYQKVYCGQIIAEIKKETNLILEQDRKHIYTEVSGETFFQNIEIAKILDKQGSISEIAKKGGLVWVLNGENYSLPKTALVNAKIGHNILPTENIANQHIINQHCGIVKFDSSTETGYLKILNFSLMLKNSEITSQTKENHLLTLKSHGVEKKFQLSVKNKNFLSDGQIIATLKENSYKTKTGGIVCYDTAGKMNNKKRRNSNKVFSGTLYWIPEETHVLISSINENLKVKVDQIIEPNTELWPGSFSKVGGLVCFDNITKELIIKPGELFSIELLANEEFLPGVFVKPGERIFKDIYAQKLSFIEAIEIKNTRYLLVRPVTTFKVPREKGFFLEYLFFPSTGKRGLKLRTVKRIFFRNWERVKSNTTMDLLQTFLVLDVINKCTSLQPQLELVSINGKAVTSHLKVSLYEVFQTNKTFLKGIKENVNASTSYLINENQFVYPKTVIAKINISAKQPGNLIGIKENSTNSKDLLVLKEKDLKYISWSSQQEKLVVSVGDLVRVGSPLTNKNRSLDSGQIYNITSDTISIRLGRPYLVSNGTVLRVKSGHMIQRSDMLATLVYEKLKTVDIVQGLPKVEEILEARKIKNGCLLAPCDGRVYLRNSDIEIITLDSKIKTFPVTTRTQTIFTNGQFIKVATPLTDGAISPHEMLIVLFNYYKGRLPIDEACKLSFKYLQLFLVNEVQKTYLSQGVKIADKHIELIVKQMTSKVRVEESGDTTLLPGEVISLLQAAVITNTISSSGGKPAFYVPILLGLTKASLSSDSFISAASFQETTRVLTEAAIEGKKDLLNGLKENVIIGQLIPAGTGFNCYKHLKKLNPKSQNLNSISASNIESVKENVLKYRFKN
jgi:DNA-directed RNA polymerase subunit beta'